jgi:hypothetical protein
MTVLQAKNMSLSEVHQLLGFRVDRNASTFHDLLTLDIITDYEESEVTEIRSNFEEYLTLGKISEGQIKLLVLAPLLRLAGFYKPPIEITLEEDIARIEVEDEDIAIAGRYDILAARKPDTTEPIKLWVLIIESKRVGIEAFMGLSQLLSYTYETLKSQSSVWGLSTNGLHFQFFHIRAGNPPTYLRLPSLSLLDPTPANQLLQVLKAICKL